MANKKDNPNVITLVAKKSVEQVDEWSMIKKLLEEQTKVMSQQKVLDLSPEIIKQIRGEIGAKGVQGVQGETGLTGETGLRGELGNRGLAGLRGKEGPLGKQGIQGNEGDKGEKGNDGFIPKHEFKNGQLRFENPDGTWGEWISLIKLLEDTGKEFGGKTLHRGFAPRFQDDETPSGTVDGANADFTLTSTPIAGSLKVYVGGSRQRETEDYTLSGNTITFIIAPETNSIILCDYRI